MMLAKKITEPTGYIHKMCHPTGMGGSKINLKWSAGGGVSPYDWEWGVYV